GQGKTLTVLKNKDGKAFNNAWSVIEDEKGNIWFGANGALWRYDPSASIKVGGKAFTKVSERDVYAIIEDKKGNIWTTGAIPGQGWALSRYDAETLYNENPTITEIMSQGPALLGLVEGADGSIWFGSMTGVYRYDGNTITDFKSNVVQK